MRNLILLALLIVGYTSTLFSQENEKSSTNTSAESQDIHPLLTDRFVFNMGLYLPTKNLRVKASSNNDEIDFNEAFDMNQKENTPAFNFIWKFSKNKKWNVGVEYFKVKSGHTSAIEKDIEWEDVVYKAGAELKVGFGVSMYRIFFGRSLSLGPKHDFGVGLGVHAMDISSFVQGEAYIDDHTTSFERKSVSAVAPFPNIGLWYFYAPTPKWALTARVDWFGITVGDFTGSLWNVAPGFKYQILDNLGVGLNYRYFQAGLDIDKDQFDGGLNMQFSGPLFTISGNF